VLRVTRFRTTYRKQRLPWASQKQVFIEGYRLAVITNAGRDEICSLTQVAWIINSTVIPSVWLYVTASGVEMILH
jgi:hypothetical protein